jgi:predicted secreted hydrolase
MRIERGVVWRTFCCILLLLASTIASASNDYEVALPGYHYSFPHDNFSHPSYQTEWWYYTGNLQSAEGHRFGFELTFFRQGVSREHSADDSSSSGGESTWSVRDLYLAHLALSDLSGGKFYHVERTNRAGPGIAGVDEHAQRIWNGNWQIQWKDAEQSLQAIGSDFQLRFTLQPEKPPVIHGENGVSQKSVGAGRASHYISLTRIATNGTITLAGRDFSVSGVSWMDHEFFTEQLDPQQVGWDWFSLQLDDHSELMLFHIRRADGSIDPFSAGTYVDAQGRSTHLKNADFTLEPVGAAAAGGAVQSGASSSDVYKSPTSGATYPIRWKIAVPKLNLAIEASTPLASQELTGGSDITPTYWEGAIQLRGSRDTKPASGVGYLEMTGYSKPHPAQPR